MTVEQKQLKVRLEKTQPTLIHQTLAPDELALLKALGVLKDLEVADEYGPKLVAAQEAVRVAEKVYFPAEKLRVENEKKRVQAEKDLAAFNAKKVVVLKK